MKLKNRVNVKNSSSQILVSYGFLGSIVIGLLTLMYFNFSSSISFATDHKSKESVKATGNDFRILQNGTPIMPIMGVAVNSKGIFNIQVRTGIDIIKNHSKPLSTEVSIIRDQLKLDSLRFNDINELKSKDLQPWIKSHYQMGDKIAIELFNTVLEEGQSVKVYSLASVY